MDAQKFGAFIAEMRKARGLTQAALAAQLHVTDKAVSRWERGLGFPTSTPWSRWPKARSLINIAFALFLTVECVFYTVQSVGYAAETLRTPPEETVTRQYTALCLERDFGVAEEQLTGTVFTLTPRDEWEGWDDLYSYTFTWQSGDGAASQCYSVVFYDDYSCEALGHGADFDASLDAANRERYRRMHGLPET